MTLPPLLATNFTRSMKINVFTSPRFQEFVEELQQQKLLVGLLVINRQVHLDIDGGHGCMSKVDLFYIIDPY
jgi:hypothetical protein